MRLDELDGQARLSHTSAADYHELVFSEELRGQREQERAGGTLGAPWKPLCAGVECVTERRDEGAVSQEVLKEAGTEGAAAIQGRQGRRRGCEGRGEGERQAEADRAAIGEASCGWGRGRLLEGRRSCRSDGFWLWGDGRSTAVLRSSQKRPSASANSTLRACQALIRRWQ